jgi:TPR repeat protein
MTALGAPPGVRYPPRTPPKDNLNRSINTPSPSSERYPVDAEGYRIRGSPLSPLHVNASSEYNVSQKSYQLTETYSAASPHSGALSAEQTPYPSTQYQPRARTSENQSFARNVASKRQDEPDIPLDVQQPPASLLASLQNRELSSPRIVPSKGYSPLLRNVSDEGIQNGRLHTRSTSDGSVRSYRSDGSNGEIQQRRWSPSPVQNHHLSPHSANRARFSSEQARNMGNWTRHGRSLSDGSIRSIESDGSLGHTGEILQHRALPPVPLFGDGNTEGNKNNSYTEEAQQYRALPPAPSFGDGNNAGNRNSSYTEEAQQHRALPPAPSFGDGNNAGNRISSYTDEAQQHRALPPAPSFGDGNIASNRNTNHTGEAIKHGALPPAPLFSDEDTAAKKDTGRTEEASQPGQLAPSVLEYHHLSPQVRLVDDEELDAINASRQSRSPAIQLTGTAEDYSNSQAEQRKTPPFLGDHVSRPTSAFSSTSEALSRGRAHSPNYSPGKDPRAASSHGGKSPDNRSSWQDLLTVSYPQPAPAANLNNSHLQNAVGSNASLLSTRQTLEMYRANVKKTNDPAIQYEFAIFMVNAVQEARAQGQNLDPPRQQSPSPGKDRIGTDTPEPTPNSGLLKEAREILQRLADKSYPFAQYYLADGYASGLFNNGKPDNDRAFPLFVAASKHGHAEAGYRTALCYEYGWGTRSDPQKAVQFYRQSASKKHPGAMERLGRACLAGELGLGNRYREGVKWLKRAAESADFQYNSAPYELGLLHEKGYGEDLFRDESYAAQLFVQSAELGHAEANYRLGDAYEHGKLNCPRDPALSVHYYNGAAQREHPLAMMALCAWYMVGAEPVLEKDEAEAYEWAKKAAEAGK